MGFLAPVFLLGALAVALPVYLHLLRRNTSNPLPFSSLMFFEARQESSTQRRRLRYWLLLALRLAVVLLLALTFANPYVSKWVTGAAVERLLLIAVDNSYSMHAGTRLADAKRAALQVVASRRVGDRAQILEVNSQVHVLTQVSRDPGTLRAAIDGIRQSDSRGSFGVLVTAVRAIAASEQLPVEFHLFSDMQRTNLAPSFAEMALPRGVTLVPHPVGSAATPNWVVESVSAPAVIWDPYTTHVQAVIAGYGTPAARRTVSFVVNGKTIATRQVDVPASGRATAEIDSLELPYGFSRCSVRIDAADALPADDEYVFALERADRQRGLLVSQPSDARSPLYFEHAVAAAAHSAVVLSEVTTDHLAGVDPASYSFVVIADVAALPPEFAGRVLDYIHRGARVLVVLGTAAAQQKEPPFFGGRILALHQYSRDAERFAAVGQTDSTYPAAGTQAEWEGVRFFYAASVDEHNARVGVRLQDGTPLVLEKTLGEGRVILFTSGLDNLTNDLPLHPVFVAFAGRLVHDLSGNAGRAGPRVVDDMLSLRTTKEQAVGVEVLDPSGQRPLSLQEAVAAQSFPLTQAGFYEVHLANGRKDLIAVNPDRRESDLAPMDADVLALWRGGSGSTEVAASSGAGTVPGVPSSGVSAAAQSSEVPRSLWWYAMLCVLAAALAESALGGRYLQIKRDEP